LAAAPWWAQLQERNKRLLLPVFIASNFPICVIGYRFGWQYIYSHLISLLFFGVSGVGLLLLLRLANFRGNWPVQFPWLASVLVFVVIVIFFSFDFAYELNYFYSAIFFTSVMSVLVCLCGRDPKLTFLAPSFLLGVLVGLATIFWVGFGGIYGFIGAFYVAFAITTLVILGWMMITRKTIDELRYPLWLLLSLNISLLAMSLLALVYAFVLENSERHVVEAVIVAIAVFGELLLSGHSVTNVDSAWFPRRSRILLFFSFVVWTLALYVFLTAMHGPAERLRDFKFIGNPEFVVYVGISVFGPAMLWALFILRIGQWFAGRQERYSPVPTR
jgi:hypothetical protein